MTDIREAVARLVEPSAFETSSKNHTRIYRHMHLDEGKAWAFERADAILALIPTRDEAALPEGWVAVPREPTSAMIAAAGVTPGMTAVNEILIRAAQTRGDRLPLSKATPLEQAWVAMIAAAPQAQPVSELPEDNMEPVIICLKAALNTDNLGDAKACIKAALDFATNDEAALAEGRALAPAETEEGL